MPCTYPTACCDVRVNREFHLASRQMGAGGRCFLSVRRDSIAMLAASLVFGCRSTPTINRSGRITVIRFGGPI